MSLSEAVERRLREIVRASRELRGTLECAYRVEEIPALIITGGQGEPLRAWQSVNPYGRTTPRANVLPIRTFRDMTDAECYAALAEVAEKIAGAQ